MSAASSLAMWYPLLMYLVQCTAPSSTGQVRQATVLCRAKMQLAAEETLQALRNADDALIELNSEASSSVKQDRKSKGGENGRGVTIATASPRLHACSSAALSSPLTQYASWHPQHRMSSKFSAECHSPKPDHTESQGVSLKHSVGSARTPLFQGRRWKGHLRRKRGERRQPQASVAPLRAIESMRPTAATASIRLPQIRQVRLSASCSFAAYY